MIWILLLIGAVILLSSSKSAVPEPTPVSPNTAANPVIYKTVSAYNTGTKPAGYVSTPVVQDTPIAPVVITRMPPAGYSGPTNGPFTWSGVGDPPNGVYTTIGIAVNNGSPLSPPVAISVRPDGYGTDCSTMEYVWIGQNVPPNGQWRIPIIPGTPTGCSNQPW